MYRPENWKTAKDDLINSKAPIEVQIAHSAGFEQGYESGATAILKSLMSQGVRGYVQGIEVRPNWIGNENIGYSCNGMDYMLEFVSDNKPSNRLNFVRLEKGYFVFIPE